MELIFEEKEFRLFNFRKERDFGVMKQIEKLLLLFMMMMFSLILIAICGCGGDSSDSDNGSDNNPSSSTEMVSACGPDFRINITGCSWSSDTSEMTNINRNTNGEIMSFWWTVTPTDGNCADRTVQILVYGITYDLMGDIRSANYNYAGTTHKVNVKKWPDCLYER